MTATGPETIQAPTKSLADRQEVRALSDALKGELENAPVHWSKYRARYPERIDALERLHQRQMVRLEDNHFFITFLGMLALGTREARRLLRVCERMFAVLVAHYREHTNEPLQARVIAARGEVEVDDVVIALRVLQRAGPTVMSAGAPPFTADSLVSGHERLVQEKTFRRFAAALRKDILSPVQPFNIADSSSADARESALFSPGLSAYAGPEVQTAWAKCLQRCDRDPEGAITAARSLLEAVCKQVLDSYGVEHSQGSSLNELYRVVARTIELDVTNIAPDAVRRLLGGCASIVGAVAELRNAHGDSHGKAPRSPKPGRRHAKLAVTAAAAAAAFLLNSDEARRTP